MVWIAFSVDDFARSVSGGVDNDATTNGAVGADGGGFLGPANFERLGLRLYRCKVKTQSTESEATYRSTRDFHEISSCNLHGSNLPSFHETSVHCDHVLDWFLTPPFML